jgi:hypothetical protein
MYPADELHRSRRLRGRTGVNLPLHIDVRACFELEVLHVFARTRGTPSNWFYRTRTSQLTGSGKWSAWSTLDLDIPASHLMPVIWDRRLYLVWSICKEQSERPHDQTAPTAGGGTSATAQKYRSVAFAASVEMPIGKEIAGLVHGRVRQVEAKSGANCCATYVACCHLPSGVSR